MKFFVVVFAVLLFTTPVFAQSYSPSSVPTSSLSVGFSPIVGAGESRAANIGIRNEGKKPLKNIVVMVKIKFEQMVKGKTVAGESTENFTIKTLKPGATFETTKHYADQITKLTSAVVESVLDVK
jgi:hypothetical protein